LNTLIGMKRDAGRDKDKDDIVHPKIIAEEAANER
jgi:hypothetical protein